MSHNPNTVKSQHELTNNDELGRTMTLLRAIEQLEKTECELERAEHKAERLQKQLDIAVVILKEYANRNNWDCCFAEKDVNEGVQFLYPEARYKAFGYEEAENALAEIKELENEIPNQE